MRTPKDKSSLANQRLLLKELLRSDFSYSRLSEELGVSKGCLWRFVNRGYLPKDTSKQKALGIGLVDVSVIPCPNCGGVHTRACRPKRVKVERKLEVNADVVRMFVFASALKKMENIQ